MLNEIQMLKSNDNGISGQAQNDETAGTVFVFSEDHGVRSALVLLLGAARFHAVGFDSAATFIASAVHSEDLGCLVIDHHVPGGADGLSVLERFAAMGRLIPVIILSDRADALFCRRSVQAGAVAVLIKPMLDDALLDAIEGAMQRVGQGD